MTAASGFDGFRLVVIKQKLDTQFKIAEVKGRGSDQYEITAVVSPSAADQSALWFSFADYCSFFEKDALLVESGESRLCSEITGDLLALLENLEPLNFPEQLAEKLGYEYRVGFDLKSGEYSVYRFFHNTSELVACGCSGNSEQDFIFDWILYRTAFACPVIILENISDGEFPSVKLHQITDDYLDIMLTPQV